MVSLSGCDRNKGHDIEEARAVRFVAQIDDVVLPLYGELLIDRASKQELQSEEAIKALINSKLERFKNQNRGDYRNVTVGIAVNTEVWLKFETDFNAVRNKSYLSLAAAQSGDLDIYAWIDIPDFEIHRYVSCKIDGNLVEVDLPLNLERRDLITSSF